ncbi:SIP domain-containing protein [Streptomyces sp. SID8382]|uniref:siderophore-interacting protein n=1 Tax=Streptomyces malaysiensis TaxID=92644 RepID=UPI000C2C37D1|nr:MULTISPECIES: siderophore-interacting protein [unclassified Streptomyces]AUA14967.1 Vibriobactin utilization protein ViuB [Streptomyces sp. M56]MYX63200.1 SIP domain-containing protein [Streptomyces sp. SID8382]
MADRPARKTRTPYRAQVLRTDRLTPHMVRVVLGGDGLADFHAGECTDHYIKILFPTGGATYPEPFDLERIRADFPREQWPVTRTYTVRAWDPAARELTVDFVTHGDEGLAGPWATRVQPGEEIHFMGPGGAYAPSPEAGWHLLAGDESALPAIAAALERLTDSRAGGAAEVPVRVFIEVAGEADEVKLTVPEGAEVSWLHRGAAPVGEALVAAVRGLEFPSGQLHAFVHGEAGFVKEIRRHLRLERQIPREWLSISGYWRRGHDEDGWQASKREWNQQVEAEQEGAGPQEAAA